MTDTTPLETLRDLWLVRWGYASVKVPGASFWWGAGCRLWGNGLMVRANRQDGRDVFRLIKTDPVGPVNKE